MSQFVGLGSGPKSPSFFCNLFPKTISILRYNKYADIFWLEQVITFKFWAHRYMNSVHPLSTDQKIGHIVEKSSKLYTIRMNEGILVITEFTLEQICS